MGGIYITIGFTNGSRIPLRSVLKSPCPHFDEVVFPNELLTTKRRTQFSTSKVSLLRCYSDKMVVDSRKSFILVQQSIQAINRSAICTCKSEWSSKYVHALIVLFSHQAVDDTYVSQPTSSVHFSAYSSSLWEPGRLDIDPLNIEPLQLSHWT
jgi:hypothetical protein